MSRSPTTRPSLLIRIRKSRDDSAWRQFVEIYTPLVYHYARKRGLQDADAADLAQEVLGSVATAIQRFEYDPKRGTFRGWLFTLTRNKLLNFISSRRRSPQGTGDTKIKNLLDEQPDAETDELQWDQQYQRRLFSWASNQVKSEFKEATWRAFWQTAVENQPAKRVAEALGVSVGAIYIAKSRVLARLRQKIQEVLDE